jgi:HD domain
VPTRKNELIYHDIPGRERAEELLAESAALNPGPWERHSRHVARGAELIAAHCPGLDAERAYILGLLHDTGRRFGVTGMRHALDGYQFFDARGYSGAARACITHSYPIREEPHGATPWDGSKQEWQVIAAFLANIEYDDYDRLIQLCDALALPDGLCLLEKRLLDVTLRYGCNEYTVRRWKAYIEIKEHFERAIGGSIYRLLPRVVENTFGWGNPH